MGQRLLVMQYMYRVYTYVDDSTLFEICEMNRLSLMQESVNIAAEWTNTNDMKIK